jgi:hypothetical protein
MSTIFRTEKVKPAHDVRLKQWMKRMSILPDIVHSGLRCLDGIEDKHPFYRVPFYHALKSIPSNANLCLNKKSLNFALPYLPYDLLPVTDVQGDVCCFYPDYSKVKEKDVKHYFQTLFKSLLIPNKYVQIIDAWHIPLNDRKSSEHSVSAKAIFSNKRPDGFFLQITEMTGQQDKFKAYKLRIDPNQFDRRIQRITLHSRDAAYQLLATHLLKIVALPGGYCPRFSQSLDGLPVFLGDVCDLYTQLVDMSIRYTRDAHHKAIDASTRLLDILIHGTRKPGLKFPALRITDDVQDINRVFCPFNINELIYIQRQLVGEDDQMMARLDLPDGLWDGGMGYSDDKMPPSYLLKLGQDIRVTGFICMVETTMLPVELMELIFDLVV